MLKVFLALLVGGVLSTPAFAAELSCSITDVCSSESQVWLLCKKGRVLLGDAEGAIWQEQQLPTEGEPRAIRFLDTKRGFVAGKNGMLLATEDGGQNWRQIPLPVEEHLLSIHFVGELGWVAGWGGVILHSTDGGRTWNLQESPGAQGLEGIYFADADHGWAVGWVGTILRTTDGGETWKEIDTEAAEWTLHSVYFRDVENGWAVGFGGQILRSRDGGATWERQPSPVTSALTSILLDKSNQGWITTAGGMLISDDGGESWSEISLGQRLFLTKVLPVGGTLWAVGARGILEESDGEFGPLRPIS